MSTNGDALVPALSAKVRLHPLVKISLWVGIILAAVTVVGVLVWQGVTARGNPDPTVDGVSRGAAIVDTGVLVFREGLEAILVLAALTASLVRTEKGYWKPVALGAGVSFLASIVTWFVVVGVIAKVSSSISPEDPSVGELHVQAATGLLAIVVLLVVMNWFFHRIYWTGWITLHNRRKNAVIAASGTSSRAAIFRGLALIGFTSVYREGFEVVLFLQSMRLKVGSSVVLEGALIGLSLTLMVAFLTFVVQYKLPYKKMLVFTGIMLGVVLLVMVGEEVQEMQLANWISTTKVNISMPDWMNLWFGVFPTVESLGSQVFAAVLVIGSYFLARRMCAKKRRNDPAAAGTTCLVPDCGKCDIPKEQSKSEQPVQISVHSTEK